MNIKKQGMIFALIMPIVYLALMAFVVYLIVNITIEVFLILIGVGIYFSLVTYFWERWKSEHKEIIQREEMDEIRKSIAESKRTPANDFDQVYP